MSDFRFTIAGTVPGVNHTYRIVYVGGHARLAKHPEVEAWQTEVAYRTKLARPRGWEPTRRIRITLCIWFKREGRDADGIMKALLDGIAKGLDVDDRHFLPCVTSVEVDRVNPRIEVEIERIEEGSVP